MNEEKKCNKYEALFIFQDEKTLAEHIQTCKDCREEDEKYKKVSALVKEAAGEYLNREYKRKNNVLKKIACCLIVLTGLTSYIFVSQVSNNSEISYDLTDDSYISSIGLPVDDYGFLEI